jgi:hypothetical protein
MNDPQTLGFYTTMQIFRNDPNNAGMILQFPPTLAPEQRRTVRGLAFRLNLDHTTHGTGHDRFITISRRPTPPLDLPSNLVSHSSQPHLQAFSRPFPTSRASTEHLSTDSRPSLYPGLRSVRSTGNLQAEPVDVPPLPTMPSPELFQNRAIHDPFDPRLTHRASQDSTGSGTRSIIFGNLTHTNQPTRQPIGPPQDNSRGFSSRDSFSQIRPIGHGVKTSGSLSHRTSLGSRGGSDPILDLQIQSPTRPEFRDV